MRRVIALIVLTFSLNAQSSRSHKTVDPDDPVRLPNGKMQQDEILKADHEKDVADARELARLATELKDELEKSDAFVLSLGALKKTDDIEKITKRIRGRIKRY
jgi:cell division septation protein DedD